MRRSYATGVINGDAPAGEAKVYGLGDVKSLMDKNARLIVALTDLLNIIEADALVPESVSYMKQARSAVKECAL